jgi:Flp pilus assembly protein TadG
MPTRENAMNGACKQTDRAWRGADRNGAAAVEFALTAPILFLFLFAALEFGRYNMLQQTANNAAFEAARQCILPGAAASDGQTVGLNILRAARMTGGAVAINPATITTTTTQVTATVTVPVTSNLWAASLFCKSTSITKSCTLTCDRVDSAP